VVTAVTLFFPAREALGFDPRYSTPGVKRRVTILAADVSSFTRARVVTKSVLGLSISANTIERICLDVGGDLADAATEQWKGVLTGEVVVPEVAIVEFDGGRIRTRKEGCGPGVHLSAKGWNETKNAIFVSAASETSACDPQPKPPACFLDAAHVAKITEQSKTREKQGSNEDLPDGEDDESIGSARGKSKTNKPPHKPKQVLRTVSSSMQNSHKFGPLMAREAQRRRFDEAARKAYVADGLTCNWTIHKTHFADYVPILDFTHAVSYLFTASVACFGKTDAAWSAYCRWMELAWLGDVEKVLQELREHQTRIGDPDQSSKDMDPREQLRVVIGYLRNNHSRMHYAEYRRAGLPTTSAWMESTIKQMNYRIKGTEKFWNNPTGAEAILQIRSAALSDDDRLTRFLTNRNGRTKLRKTKNLAAA